MSTQPLRQASIELSPPFHDVDSMRVVWHGNYLRYFELARCELLKGFGYDYLDMEASGYFWPIVDTRLKFVRSARYGQTIRVCASLVEWENRMKINYLITDAASGEKLTEGYTIQVAVHKDTGVMEFVSPPILGQKLGLSA
ncbi:MAG: acyl-CoA thioesterase [Gammaproteobacteria bacterium]|nr:acyl-CoA thioesterase [Gammaproteobacteria bacterium]